MTETDTGLIRPHENLLGVLYRLTDAILILATLWFVAQRSVGFDAVPLSFLAPFSIVVFWPIADSMNLYRSWRTAQFLELVLCTCCAWLISFSIIFLASYLFYNPESLMVSPMGYWCAICLFVLLVWRFAFRLTLRFLRRRNFNSRSAIVVCANETAQYLVDQIENHEELGIRMLGYYDDRQDASRNREQDIEGSTEDAVNLARSGDVDLVFIALPMSAEIRIQGLLERFADSAATVFIIPNFFIHDLLSSRWHKIGSIDALSIYDTPNYGLGGWVKRLEDVVLSAALLVVFAIPMFLIAVAIRVSDGGAAIFIQERYGMGRRKINVLKFRTMYVAENGHEVKQATRHDSRVTPLGRWLRATSLDELPQLFNVLAGSMSIVGPRPHAVAHNEEYRTQIHGYMLRHKVKPGITGWAQINGYRGETDTVGKMESRIRHDLDYINRWSVWLDLKIVLLTVVRGAMFDENAY